MAISLGYEVYEDNGGGLYLAVLRGDDCVYLGSDYEQTDTLTDDLRAIERGADPIADGWEGNADDPVDVYGYLTATHAEIVASYYPDGCGDPERNYSRMGGAARRAFGVPQDV